MTLRVGVIGLGFVGRAHVDALRRIPGIQVAAAAGSGPHVTAQAEPLGIAKAYADYRELIADPDVDAIHNCTPNYLHFPINCAALEAGKACFAEKPLTASRHEAEELVRLARARGVPVATNFNHRGFPQIQEARARIARGDLGRVFTVHGSYLQDWLLYPTDWNWRVDPAANGASRTVADIGSHWMDLAQHVIQSPIVELLADLHTALPTRYRPGETTPIDIQSEDFGSILVRFANGAHGAFNVSQISAGRRNQLTLEVDGARAALAWSSEDSERLWWGTREHGASIAQRDPRSALVPETSTLPAGHAEGWNDALRTTIAGFYAMVRSGEPAQPWVATWEDGLRAVVLTEAILRSHQQRQWVALAL